MSRIAVLGPGGVGGFIAAALARAGETVRVVARESSADAIAQNGISVQSLRLGDFVAWPNASPRLSEPADVLIVATKAVGLEDALQRISAPIGLAVPLLNGLDHMATLRARFERVAAGVIRVESACPAPGTVVQSSPFLRVDLASDDPALRPAIEALRATLEHAGVPSVIGAGEAEVLWSKLVRLCALALTTAASGLTLGAIREDPQWRAALRGCVEEAAAVARADGASGDPEATWAELEEAHAALTSSLARDVAAGRPSELDAIAGAVLRAGARYGIACQTVERLAALVGERAPQHS